MIVMEISPAVDAAGTLQTLYISNEPFNTIPSDTPPNEHFMPRLMNPGVIGLNAFSDGKTGGATKLEVGEITVANVDGALDSWLNYSFDGRGVIIRSGSQDDAYPSGFKTIMVGTLDSVEGDWEKIIFRLRDKLWVLEKTLLTTFYAGSNVAPDGVEGSKGDIAGQVKPRFWGKVTNVTPPCVNTSKLVYETGSCLSIDNVYDRAAALTKGADYTDYSDMMTNAPAASNFRAWPAGGYFRLGSAAAGTITFNGTEGANAAARTVAQLMKRVALHGGVPGGDISAADVIALDASNSAVMGVWVSDESSASSVMDRLAEGAGVYYGYDNHGVLRMGQLTAPSGTPVTTLYEYQTNQKISRKSPKEPRVPSYRAIVEHTFNYTVQDTDIATSVSSTDQPRVAFLAEQVRKATVEDLSVKVQWLLSEPMTFKSLFTVEADAIAEATRRLSIYKVRRDFYTVKLDLQIYEQLNLNFLDVVELQLPRFNMSAGKSFRLLGTSLDLRERTVALTLWG